MATTMQHTVSIKEEIKPVPPRPTILVFDSGVGGLSVYQEVQQQIPDAYYIYVFDNAGFPYGEKTESFIIERVQKIVAHLTQRYEIALAIVACNTASTITLPILRQQFGFPVVGVVPAIKPAAQITRNGVVGLLATKGTITRQYTHELIKQFATDCQIEMIGASSLVEIAERKLHKQSFALNDISSAVEEWLNREVVPDTIVLGCTHFPLLRDELSQIFPKGTQFVDSGAAIAKRALWLLSQMRYQASTLKENIAYCTRNDEKIGHLLPVLQHYGFGKIETLTNIDLIE